MPAETRLASPDTPETKAADVLSQARQAESHVPLALQFIARAEWIDSPANARKGYPSIGGSGNMCRD